jgi:N6-adenosine-specific RNA methylase IME4
VQHGGADKPFTSSAGSFYDVISIEDLCTLPVKDIRDPEGSVCFMWTTGPILEDSLRLMKAWGFKYKQIAFVWDKQRVNPGAYTMTQCEYVLVGTHRRIPKPRGARNVRQFLQSARTKHSAKPHVIRDRIHEMFPNQEKVELFARDSMPGWLAWGNEV